MPDAIFTPMAGALGDMLTYYLEGELGYFKALQARGHVTKVKAWSVTDQAAALFRPRKDIDAIDIQDFAPAAGKTVGFRDWAARGESQFRLMTDAERASLPWQQPKFDDILDDTERQIADAMWAFRPYIAVHPFAGKPERSLAAQGLAQSVIEAAARYGRVVILGGDSQRNGANRVKLHEHFEAPIPNVFNLVGRHSVRLHAHVAATSAKFIGTVSAYNCVAEHFKVPSLIFGSKQNKIDMKEGGAVFAKMRARGTPIHFLDDKPDVRGLVEEFVR